MSFTDKFDLIVMKVGKSRLISGLVRDPNTSVVLNFTNRPLLGIPLNTTVIDTNIEDVVTNFKQLCAHYMFTHFIFYTDWKYSAHLNIIKVMTSMKEHESMQLTFMCKEL